MDLFKVFGNWLLVIIWLLACLRETASAEASAWKLVIIVYSVPVNSLISLWVSSLSGLSRSSQSREVL